jgi:hypothetical protein
MPGVRKPSESERSMGNVVDIEAGRLRRWERRKESNFRQVDQDMVWFCACGCWQFELRPVGVFCLGCQRKQSVVINPQ